MSYVGCPYIFMDADINPDSAIEQIRMNLIQVFSPYKPRRGGELLNC